MHVARCLRSNWASCLQDLIDSYVGCVFDVAEDFSVDSTVE